MKRIKFVHELFSFLLIIILFIPYYAYGLNNHPDITISEFLAKQQLLRIVADDSGGFGNQSASSNLVIRLRQLGFKGLFEFYYLAEARNKIITLFDLPKDMPHAYLDMAKQIEFIKISDKIWDDDNLTSEKLNIKDNIALGLSGALDHESELVLHLSFLF